MRCLLTLFLPRLVTRGQRTSSARSDHVRIHQQPRRCLLRGLQRQPELLDAVITDDWDDIPLGPGRAGARSLIEGLTEVVSDLRFVVEEIMDARGDDGNGMVGVRATMHGVYTRVVRHRADRSPDRGPDA
jgi:hypothetical protein